MLYIYDTIKDLCEDRGLTIFSLEQKAGIANGLIDNWKDGGNPKIGTLVKIAQALDVTVDTLIAEKEL